MAWTKSSRRTENVVTCKIFLSKDGQTRTDFAFSLGYSEYWPWLTCIQNLFFLAAQTIWELGSKKDNPSDFALAMDNSELKEFGFTDDFVFDLWGAISDAKSGRLTKDVQEFNEQF